MKRVVAAFLWGSIVLSTSLSSAGHAAREYVRFDAPVPCSLACPAQTDFVRDPVVGEDEGACEKHPVAPPGSWDDLRVTVPKVVDGSLPNTLRVDLSPMLDRDLFVCKVLEPGTPEETYEFSTVGIVPFGESCAYDPAGMGCDEFAIVNVKPDQVYVIRVYNWLDVYPAVGWFSFFHSAH